MIGVFFLGLSRKLTGVEFKPQTLQEEKVEADNFVRWELGACWLQHLQDQKNSEKDKKPSIEKAKSEMRVQGLGTSLRSLKNKKAEGSSQLLSEICIGHSDMKSLQMIVLKLQSVLSLNVGQCFRIFHLGACMGYPSVRPELDLVESEDQLTHEYSLLDDEIDPETSLDIFKFDPNFLENEKQYEELKKSIVGEESEKEDGSDAKSDDKRKDKRSKSKIK
ncbi:hypothetical protein Nepgr_020958 [Nepenthes gracilis]|uniref:Uncharacterized protein n=1 Tax=Nepenthes gracilis TaxID=150966 RepID=A0AAD3SXY4_NEPGR|nr:hypothetical protein Nepgr_020958 [Nepenthes gracilis]